MLIKHQSTKPIENFSIVINGNKITRVNQIKYLGVFIDENLSWQPHIEDLCRRLSRVSGMLFKIRNCLNRQTLLTLYHALAHSLIQYGIATWGSASKKHLHHLSVTQNRLIRTITFSNRRTKLAPLYEECNVLPLSLLYKFEIAKFVFKFKNQLLPNKFTSYFQEINAVHQHNTRLSENKNYFLPRVQSTKSTFSLRFLGPQIWNVLPSKLIETTNLKTFSKILKMHFLQNSTNDD